MFVPSNSFQPSLIIHGLGTRLVFDTWQIAIIVGELYSMLPDSSQVRHSKLFPRMGIHQNILNKMNWNNIKYFQLQVLSSPFSFFLFLVRNCWGSDFFGCLYFDMGLLMALWRSFSSFTVKQTLGFLSPTGRGLSSQLASSGLNGLSLVLAFVPWHYQ